MKKKSSKKLLYLSFLFVSLTFSFWIYNNRKSNVFSPNKDKISIQLQWIDGPQFMGIYMAEHKDFFRKENIDVEIISGGYATNPFETVRSGRAHIGIATGDQVLIQKSKGEAYKAIGTVFNKSMACFMAKEKTAKYFTDIIGKKVGVYKNFDTENILLSMLLKKGINLDSLEIISASGNLESFFNNDIDFFPSYRFNEPITAELRNVPVKLFKPEENGIFFYSDTFFCKEEFLSKNKDLVKRFLKAVSKGWEYSKENPDESIDYLINSFNTFTTENKAKMKKELEVILKHIGAGNNNKPLVMEKSKWEQMEKMLYEINKIDSLYNIDELCDFNLIK